MADWSARVAHDEGGFLIPIILDGGRRVLVRESSLIKRQDNLYSVQVTFAEAEERASAVVTREVDAITIPVIEESLQITKREVEMGRIRLTKTVHEREEMFDEPLAQEEANVERVAVNRVVEGPLPEARYEGETLVIPLFEEVLVVEKKVMLKEELRITKKRFETRTPQPVVLRSEQVNIERLHDKDQAAK